MTEHDPFEPVREEDHRLRLALAALHAVADRADGPVADLTAELDDVLVSLDELVAAGRRRARVLYPAVEAVLGTADATATMRRDLLEVTRLVGALRHLTQRLSHEDSKQLRRDIRRTLVALDVIGHLHLDKEEGLHLRWLAAALPGDEAAALARAATGTRENGATP